MKYTDAFFDEYQERRGTDSTKWDNCNEKFGVDADMDMVPMWIADMDFRSPVEVEEEMVRRARLGSYGYVMKTDALYETIISWIQRRYHWTVEKDWIVITPGVIPGLHIAVQQLTEPGDGVIVQPPIYYPFMTSAEVNGRQLVVNPLIEKDGDWYIDFEDLEAKAKEPRNKLLLFCNPHNPVGRVWTPEEIERVSRICAENQVVLITDELHADLIMKGYSHHAVNAVCPQYRDNTISYYAPSKTFNLAGLQTAVAIIPDPTLREKFLHGLNANRIFNVNWFGQSALITAWTKCDDYVEALCHYIDANMEYMKDFIDHRLPVLKMKKSQATYMVFVDFRGTGMRPEAIEAFITQKARIGVDMGSWFGIGGAGYLRFNLACPRSTLEKALRQLEEALQTL